MNMKVILYTIFLLNFLEAFILVYGTHILDPTTRYSRFKLSINLLIKIWILGVINYVFQYVEFLLPNAKFVMVYNVIVPLIIVPITLYLYINRFICKKSIITCYISTILYIFTLILCVMLFNSDITDYSGIWSIFIEKISQFIMIFGVDKIVKRFFSKDCNKFK